MKGKNEKNGYFCLIIGDMRNYKEISFLGASCGKTPGRGRHIRMRMHQPLPADERNSLTILS